jgi:hypothetical protein
MELPFFQHKVLFSRAGKCSDLRICHFQCSNKRRISSSVGETDRKSEIAKDRVLHYLTSEPRRTEAVAFASPFASFLGLCTIGQRIPWTASPFASLAMRNASWQSGIIASRGHFSRKSAEMGICEIVMRETGHGFGSGCQNHIVLLVPNRLNVISSVSRFRWHRSPKDTQF